MPDSFDVASRLGLEKSDADTGQTLGLYGVNPGPYLILPFLPPLTVRDAIGYAADSFMDPLSYFVTPLLANVGRSAANTINQRADNMTLYQDVEDTSLDLYAAVRNGYLQRRRKSIEGAIRDRDRTWESISDPFDAQSKYRFATRSQCLDDPLPQVANPVGRTPFAIRSPSSQFANDLTRTEASELRDLHMAATSRRVFSPYPIGRGGI